ncbi:PREDICTED: uncharacterized protein LOC109465549 [Branchiostoma belcheri]|uniref:Uncharacterized protein LOC109465549 n=1 Tax=Branchiostoma belcheri TaxID=7741 RepID=A0A6P4YMS8_BRABE|nr:PREDICTED: uncharacterized protein LOC109465549 [Branchiostoma belcheri]
MRHAKYLRTTDRLCLLYICSVLMAQAEDLETNPGPRAPKYPCGSCGKAVTFKHKAVCCDKCDFWFHHDCQGLSSFMYSYLGNSNVSWICLNCGLPNFSTTFFSNSDDLSSPNPFSPLSDASPGVPLAASSPKSPVQNKRKLNGRPLRLINANFQSLKNKKVELETLVEETKPDILVITETWLDSTCNITEYFPNHLNMQVFYRNRPEDSHGGVLIAVSNEFICTQEPDLETDCEMVWVKIELVGSKSLNICAYYRPQVGDSVSLDLLEQSMERICNKRNNHVWIVGDFNFPGWDWVDPHQPVLKPDSPYPGLHRRFLELLSDHNMSQVVDKPTR